MPVNEDLVKERKNCSFNQLEITHLIDGGPEKTKQRRELNEFFLSDKALRDDVPTEYLSHKEKYERSVKKSVVVLKKLQEWTNINSSMSTLEVFELVLSGRLTSSYLGDGFPLVLHYIMFIPTLIGQGSKEQQALWVPRAWNNEFNGTYAQTELGHGTFIRGLETTATYDPRTEEFVLHSPTLTSYKWWPGGLGHTSNYAIVMAQLITKGVCYGIHSFIVQLRDKETHMPLPGIKIGDIGAKMGLNGSNNGYLGFDNYRIPRMNMLMKNSQVLQDGSYVKGMNEKLTYGTMIFMRVNLIKGIAMNHLMMAVTIAVRYSAVRRQCHLHQGQREAQILDYKTQQYKLFPYISSVFAMLFTSKWLYEMFVTVTNELEEGDTERLPELHAMSCCMKAMFTYEAAQGIEECRKACGGHGYMESSGLPSAYGMTTAAETYEGENTVLYLQTARYLMKAWGQARGGQRMPETCKYMEEERHKQRRFTPDLPSTVTAYEDIACGLVEACQVRMQNLVQREGLRQDDAWNQTSNLLVQASQAHCRAFIVRFFRQSVISLSPTLSEASLHLFNLLTELYCVHFLLKDLGMFLIYSGVRVKDVVVLRDWEERLLSEIRPLAVSLVDSFDIPDEILNSALGAYDGDVYQRLFDEANRCPLNREPVNRSFHEYLKPYLNSSL